MRGRAVSAVTGANSTGYGSTMSRGRAALASRSSPTCNRLAARCVLVNEKALHAGPSEGDHMSCRLQTSLYTGSPIVAYRSDIR